MLYYNVVGYCLLLLLSIIFAICIINEKWGNIQTYWLPSVLYLYWNSKMTNGSAFTFTYFRLLFLHYFYCWSIKFCAKS